MLSMSCFLEAIFSFVDPLQLPCSGTLQEMELLANYGNADSSDDDISHEEIAPPTAPTSSSLSIVLNAAPEIDHLHNSIAYVDPHAKQLTHNPMVHELYAPVHGPLHPLRKDAVSSGVKNHYLGWVEEDSVDDFTFNEQFYTFKNFGFARDPAVGTGRQTAEFIGNLEAAQQSKGLTVFDPPRKRLQPDTPTDEPPKQQTFDKNTLEACKKVREACLNGQLGVTQPFVEEVTPLICQLLTTDVPEELKTTLEKNFGWDTTAQKFTSTAVDRVLLETQIGLLVPDSSTDTPNDEAMDTSESNKRKRKEKGKRQQEDPSDVDKWMGPWAKPLIVPMGLTEEQRRVLAEQTKPRDTPKTDVRDKMAEAVSAWSVFHGDKAFDYQGRTYLSPPSDAKPRDHECFYPKKLIHTWSGHTKGVQAIRFFPKYGHLLLSASMDSTIKLWDVNNDRKCIRTFHGHSGAVRDICFSFDGAKFLSASYDRYIRLWDTETGKVLNTFTTKRTPYVVKFHPDADKQNEFLVGGSDKKIVQFDIRTEQMVQEYDQHLAAVNTITFIDENRRFVTTSDDKSIRVWEWGIPVVIKYICEPHMHSMPAVAKHPNETMLAFQSMDNQILLYSAADRFRLNRKKRFSGHTVAGYACQLNFSPDGKYLMSGDGNGNLWFWDFSTGRILQKLYAHKGVCIGCEWHPIEASRVVSCGWDGQINYWD